MSKTKEPLTIFGLSLDVKYAILDYLDNKSMAYLAQTCTYFGMLVRNIISFRKVEVSINEQHMPKIPPFLNYRAGVAVGSTFYMPFINEEPFCYSCDLNTGVWSSHKLNLIDLTDLQAQITSATVIGTKIYLVGGRFLKSYTLSNAIIEIDIANFNTRVISNVEGMPPRPRHEHSVDSIGNRYIVAFGGLCYNSVGENDVFVYDIIENRWFVPPISGHLPHLRFGHASTVIGDNLYIHGGAQLDSDSSYIIYDDLYKLDCKTWVWYKYEHPEIEKYLRNQTPPSGESPQRSDYLISTTGDSPYDRFQASLCSFGNKLFTFGGHSIREDEDENEILCSYPIDEICVFNTKRNAWTTIHAKRIASSDDEEESITLSDMSVATLSMGSRGARVYVFAGRKAAEIQRTNNMGFIDRSVSAKSSYSSSTGFSTQQDVSTMQHNARHLHSITESNDAVESEEEYFTTNRDRTNSTGSDKIEHGNQDEEGGNDESIPTKQGEVRTPNDNDLSDTVKQLFNSEPDMDMADDEEEEIINNVNNRSKSKQPYKSSSRVRRPSISLIHHDARGDHDNSSSSKNATSSSSHSSISSNGSLGNRRSHPQKKVIPCTVVIDLIE